MLPIHLYSTESREPNDEGFKPYIYLYSVSSPFEQERLYVFRSLFRSSFWSLTDKRQVEQARTRQVVPCAFRIPGKFSSHFYTVAIATGTWTWTPFCVAPPGSSVRPGPARVNLLSSYPETPCSYIMKSVEYELVFCF